MILVVSLYEGLSIVEAYCGLSTTTSTTTPTVVSVFGGLSGISGHVITNWTGAPRSHLQAHTPLMIIIPLIGSWRPSWRIKKVFDKEKTVLSLKKGSWVGMRKTIKMYHWLVGPGANQSWAKRIKILKKDKNKKIKRMRKTLHHRWVGPAANQGWAKRIKILTAWARQPSFVQGCSCYSDTTEIQDKKKDFLIHTRNK